METVKRPSKREEIRRLARLGLTATEICREVACYRTDVSNAINEWNNTHPDEPIQIVKGSGRHIRSPHPLHNTTLADLQELMQVLVTKVDRCLELVDEMNKENKPND